MQDKPETKQRIAIKLEYDGSAFCGSQMQKEKRTVQEDLERALAVFFRTGANRKIKTTFSGRTDSGVHAVGQVVHFDLDQDDFSAAFKVNRDEGILFEKAAELPKLKAPDTRSIEIDELSLMRICWALNGIMKPDLSVSQIQLVNQKFNARYSALRRTYVYRILNRAQRSAHAQNTHFFVPDYLNLEAMKAAAEALLGQHDFRAFKSSNADQSSTICRVERAEILNKGESELEFWISADHFVYNMVRIIVGTLVEIGLGKRAPRSLREALAGKDRHLAGPTAAARGLCLYSVEYPAEYALFQREQRKIRNSL